MKNNKKYYAVNRQEDEDVEIYILHPENAVASAKYKKLQQPVIDSKERIKQKHFQAAQNLNRL